MRPVILAAINRFSVTEFQKLIWLLVVVTVRWQIIGGKRTGAIEIGCARLAEKIWTCEVSRASEARSTLSNIYTSDADFRSSFESKDGLTNQKTTYLLKMIELEERKRQLGSAALEFDPGKSLSVEHVLPKNPGSEWEQEMTDDQDLKDDCVLRLGNTCLLTETLNRTAARKGFEEKKMIYSKSSILSTRLIANYKSWGRNSIDKHQRWLASRAVGIWRYS